jgi:hypothetical protein
MYAYVYIHIYMYIYVYDMYICIYMDVDPVTLFASLTPPIGRNGTATGTSDLDNRNSAVMNEQDLLILCICNVLKTF